MSLSGFTPLTCQASCSHEPELPCAQPTPLPGVNHTEPLPGVNHTALHAPDPPFPGPLTQCFLTPFLPLASWPCLLSIKNLRDVAPSGSLSTKRGPHASIYQTIISAGASNHMAAGLGPAMHNWLLSRTRQGQSSRISYGPKTPHQGSRACGMRASPASCPCGTSP